MKEPVAVDRRFAKALAARIRDKRAAAGLSQEELGARSDLHRTYIGAIERGEKNITVITLSKIARALECEISSLIPEGLNVD